MEDHNLKKTMKRFKPPLDCATTNRSKVIAGPTVRAGSKSFAAICVPLCRIGLRRVTLCEGKGPLVRMTYFLSHIFPCIIMSTGLLAKILLKGDKHVFSHPFVVVVGLVLPVRSHSSELVQLRCKQDFIRHTRSRTYVFTHIR